MDNQPNSQPIPDPEPETDPIPPPQPMDIRSTLEAARQATREVFQEEIHRAGGPGLWITKNCPSSCAALGSSLTDANMESVVESETQAFWVGIESRMRECASCPPEGAACVLSTHCFSPGVLVNIRVKAGAAQSSLKRCDRYQDFSMARRLEKVGVDRTLSMTKSSTLGEVAREFSEALTTFLTAGNGEVAPRKQQVLIEGSRAREHGVALFRSVLKNYPNASYRSVHVPSLIRECKRCMTIKEPSPLGELLEFDVLVLDGIDEGSLKNKYFMPEIQWVYERRRDQGLSTILTASISAKEVFQGANVVRVG